MPKSQGFKRRPPMALAFAIYISVRERVKRVPVAREFEQP
jgi:hypothetical protein